MRIGEFGVSVEDAKKWLRDEYPAPTVEFYDGGPASPRDKVVPADIGRLTVFAAQLRFDQAVEFLNRGRPAGDKLQSDSPPWPDAKPEWNLRIRGAALDAGAFRDHPTTKSALTLFNHFIGRRNRAQVSKLLHLKWPKFYPILDSSLRRAYGARAVEVHHELSGSRRVKSWSSACPEGYWWLFREDLIANREELRDLRRKLSDEKSKDPAVRRKCVGLGKVTLLRLQDMIAWGLGSGRMT